MKQSVFLGIEIGGTKLQVVVGDDSARILRRFRFNVAPSLGAAGIREQLETTLTELRQSHLIQAAGIGFGGPVDWRNRQICCSHQIEGWSEFELGPWVQNLLGGVPVLMDNDADVAALGEALHGAGVNANPVFYVTLGSGVGGGLVVDGRIYHGAKPGEAEIGHIRLDRSGVIVENRCSGWAVDRRIRALKQSGSASILCELSREHSSGEAQFLPRALELNDAIAHQLLGEVAGDLAFALSHVVHLFHPEVIVIGGGLSKIGEPLRAAVAKALPVYVMEAFGPGADIRLAGLGEDSVPTGALELARQICLNQSRG